MAEAHWAVIVADRIVIAQGYCWCEFPRGPFHSIGLRPPATGVRRG